MQVDQENLSDSENRLKKQALILKYAKKWMKNCITNRPNSSVSKKRNIAVTLWKLNTCFDETLGKKAI